MYVQGGKLLHCALSLVLLSSSFCLSGEDSPIQTRSLHLHPQDFSPMSPAAFWQLCLELPSTHIIFFGNWLKKRKKHRARAQATREPGSVTEPPAPKVEGGGRGAPGSAASGAHPDRAPSRSRRRAGAAGTLRQAGAAVRSPGLGLPLQRGSPRPHGARGGSDAAARGNFPGRPWVSRVAGGAPRTRGCPAGY